MSVPAAIANFNLLAEHRPPGRVPWTEWGCLTDCPTHGEQSHIVCVFPGQRPRDVARGEPVCSKCEHEGPPQAKVVKMERLPVRR